MSSSIASSPETVKGEAYEEFVNQLLSLSICPTKGCEGSYSLISRTDQLITLPEWVDYRQAQAGSQDTHKGQVSAAEQALLAIRKRFMSVLPNEKERSTKEKKLSALPTTRQLDGGFLLYADVRLKLSLSKWVKGIVGCELRADGSLQGRPSENLVIKAPALVILEATQSSDLYSLAYKLEQIERNLLLLEELDVFDWQQLANVDPVPLYYLLVSDSCAIFDWTKMEEAFNLYAINKQEHKCEDYLVPFLQGTRRPRCKALGKDFDLHLYKIHAPSHSPRSFAIHHFRRWVSDRLGSIKAEVKEIARLLIPK